MSESVQQLFAIHALVVSDPHVDMIATGTWNEDGSPVMRKASRRIPAGTLFAADLLEGGEPEVQRLIAMGAIRMADEFEIALFEQNEAEA